MTWNVHRAKGRDGRTDPARIENAIEQVLTPFDPDILALQEADGECRPHARILDVARIAAQTGLSYIHDQPTLRWGPDSDGFLGTILFLNKRFQRISADVIDMPGHCHRGAVVVEVMAEKSPIRIMSCHLSLSQPLRIIQMRVIGQYLRRRPAMQTILLGDLNEWRPWLGMAFAKKIVGRQFKGPSEATFPTQRPLLALDRILTDAPGHVEEVHAVDHPDTNMASDHRPLRGVVTVP
ncbi:MAG: endonuclease/exonuclease/phosphatase family protein [Paracoccaceae bacterium]|nr:endonuclease/exonuclease/phosphatase family protein [Paracoccaceae bacterium]